MHIKPKGLFSFGRTKIFTKKRGLYASSTPAGVRNLLLLCIALVFSVLSTSEAWAFEPQNTENQENLDVRWLPFIGSWRLTSNTINTVGTVLNEKYVLTIRPEDKGKVITIESARDDVVMFEERIEADGLRHPLNKDGCTGWYSYTWSETGKRLLFTGESTCGDDLMQEISGILIIDTAGNCVDIKLLKNGEEKAITIRRYQSADINLAPPIPTIMSKASVARVSAAANFTLDEVIELGGKIEPDVLEAALVEMRSSFPINSKQLVRLSNAGVPTQVMDLMVALSFPKKFTVERAALSWVKTTDSFRAPYYHWPLNPWYWTKSTIPPIQYWYWGWDLYQRHGWYPYNYGHIVLPGEGPGGGPGEGSGSVGGGKLVEGRGYTRIYSGDSGTQQRYAQPRNAQAAGGTRQGSSAGSSGAQSVSTSSGGNSGGSGYSAPSASPSGYSGAGTGTAQPR